MSTEAELTAADRSAPLILPPISSVPSLPDLELKLLLDTLFEPSPDLHALALPTLCAAPFASYPAMVHALRDQLLALAAGVRADPDADPAGRRRLLAILAAHPRLGEKKVESALSRMEQAGLGRTRTAEDKEAKRTEADQLARLNREYEEAFPGLRYVVFVNGRGREVIMENMRRRIARGDAAAEEREAIEAMCDIAINRSETIKKAAELQKRVMATMPEA